MESEEESVTREFDDEQYKLEEGDEEGDNDLQTMERANEIARQYEEVKDRTLGEGLVAGRLEDIDTSPANNNINIMVDLPGEENNKTFRFKKPKVWSREYDFVRWIQYYGYDADSFPNMLQGECDVEVKNIGDEEYELFIPEYQSPRREKLGNVVSSKTNILKVLYHSYRNEESNIYFTPIIGVFYLLHGMVWATPIIDYGFEGFTSFMLFLVGLVILIALFLIEEEVIKTEFGSSF